MHPQLHTQEGNPGPQLVLHLPCQQRCWASGQQPAGHQRWHLQSAGHQGVQVGHKSGLAKEYAAWMQCLVLQCSWAG
jgi:hypothetical protein